MLRVVYGCHSSLSRSIRPFFDVVLEKDLESINKVRYESIERHINMMLLFTAITICVFFGHFCASVPAVLSHLIWLRLLLIGTYSQQTDQRE